MKAEENSKNSEPVVKVPEIKPAQIAKPTVIANKQVSDSKLSSSGFKFGKPGTPDTSIRARHFNHDGNARPMERGQRTMQPRDGQRPTFNNGTRPQFAGSQNRFNNGTRPFGQNTKMQGGMVAAGTVKGSRPIQSAGQASAVSSFVALIAFPVSLPVPPFSIDKTSKEGSAPRFFLACSAVFAFVPPFSMGSTSKEGSALSFVESSSNVFTPVPPFSTGRIS